MATPRPDRSATAPVNRMVYHFSEDGAIERFVPKPAPSDPSQPVSAALTRLASVAKRAVSTACCSSSFAHTLTRGQRRGNQ